MAKKTASKNKTVATSKKTATAKGKSKAKTAAKPVLKKAVAAGAKSKKPSPNKVSAKSKSSVKADAKKAAPKKARPAKNKQISAKGKPAAKAKTPVKNTVKKEEKISKAKTTVKAAPKKDAKKTAGKKPISTPKAKISVKSDAKVSKPALEKPKKASEQRAEGKEGFEGGFSVKSRKAKAGHARASESIYFSMDDLDSFFKTRDNHSVSTAAVESKSSQGKGVSAPKVQPKVEPKSKGGNSVGVASLFDILGFDPGVAPTREKIEEKDVPRKWKKYYTLLVDLRKRYSQGIEGRAEEVLKRSAKEDSGDLSSYGQHLADAGSESFDRDMAYNILSGEKEILSEIDEAIKRIKNGTYGICEYTGSPIPDERLTAVPYTRYTKEGREQKEAELNRIKTSQRSLYDIPETPTPGGDDDAS